MRKKEKDMIEDGSFSAPVPSHAPSQPGSKLIAPADIQAKEFGVARFGGYKMRDVDEFLDLVTDSMSAVVRENEQLRHGGAGPLVGTSDLADVNRQADEIIQRARDEAAAIVANARRQGAPDAAPDADRSAADRAAIAAFLTREKAFLQSLAGLVQGHAEEVRSMARAPRPAMATTRPAEPAPAAARPEPPVADRPTPPVADTPAPKEPQQPTPSKAAETPTPSAPPQKAQPDDTVAIPTSPDRVEEPVRVVEPQPVAARQPDAGADDEGSLRELFWGED